MTFNPVFLFTFLFSVSVTFYLSKISEFSPIYLINIGLLIPSVFVLIRNRVVNLSPDVKWALIIIIYISTVHFTSVATGEFINLFTGLFGYIFIRMMSYRISKEKLLFIFKSMLRVSITLLVIDSLYRVANPTHPNKEVIANLIDSDSWFYLYKFNSIMFADSNTTALICVIFISSIWSLSSSYMKKFKSELYILIIVLLSCFSRAAIISFILVSCFRYKKVTFKRLKFIVFFGSIILSLLIGFVIDYYVDGSFQTKFVILKLFGNKFSDLSLYQILFGLGVGNSSEFLGVFPHIFILTWFLETGIVGITLIFSFFYYYSKRHGYFIPFSAMIMGLSYFLYLGAPFLFVPMALISSIKLRNV